MKLMELVDKDYPRKPRILIVDDDWLNRDLLTTYLTHMGAEIFTAIDGCEALEKATLTPPDLTLLDIQMPRMDGIEACRQLKAHPATRSMPIIMVTAMEGEDEKIKSLEAGADDFIIKPYSSVMLLSRVRALLKIKQLNDRLQVYTRLLRQVLNRYVGEETAAAMLANPEKYLQPGG
jgi:DNA-binding response OmpR family regulator